MGLVIKAENDRATSSGLQVAMLRSCHIFQFVYDLHTKLCLRILSLTSKCKYKWSTYECRSVHYRWFTGILSNSI